MERDGSKPPVPYNGTGSGPKPSSEGLAPWGVPSALLPQGDSLWLAPSAHVCGRLRGGEAGRQPTSWGYHSTIVRILQGGCGRGPGLRWADVDGDGWSWLGVRPPSAGGLAWRAPLSHRPTLQRFWKQGDTPCTPGGAAPLHPAWGAGFCFGVSSPSAEGLAWRAPLSHRPTLQRFWVQGDSPCTLGGGCAPCTPLGGGRRRFLAWRVGTLPGLPAGAGAGMGACLHY